MKFYKHSESTTGCCTQLKSMGTCRSAKARDQAGAHSNPALLAKLGLLPTTAQGAALFPIAHSERVTFSDSHANIIQASFGLAQTSNENK